MKFERSSLCRANLDAFRDSIAIGIGIAIGIDRTGTDGDGTVPKHLLFLLQDLLEFLVRRDSFERATCRTVVPKEVGNELGNLVLENRGPNTQGGCSTTSPRIRCTTTGGKFEIHRFLQKAGVRQ